MSRYLQKSDFPSSEPGTASFELIKKEGIANPIIEPTGEAKDPAAVAIAL